MQEMTRRLQQSSDGFADKPWEKKDLKLYSRVKEVLQNDPEVAAE